MPDVNGGLQVEPLDQGRQVIGVGVHVVAVPGLARAAVTAAIVRDAAVAAGGQEEHLVLEGVRAQRPAVAEDDGLSRAPVLVINLRPVLGGDGVHAGFSFDASGGHGVWLTPGGFDLKTSEAMPRSIDAPRPCRRTKFRGMRGVRNQTILIPGSSSGIACISGVTVREASAPH